MSSVNKIFNCPLSNSTLEYIVDSENQQATMDIIDLNFSKPKLAMLLLKTSIEELKLMGITFILQRVSEQDFKQYLKDKTTWEIINFFYNEAQECTFLLKCSIDDVLSNIYIGTFSE